MKSYTTKELDLILGALYASLNRDIDYLNKGLEEGRLDMSLVYEGTGDLELLIRKIIEDIRGE